MEKAQDELGAAHALAGELHRRVREMKAGGVDVRRVADPQLHVHGRRGADHVRNLVEADEAALVVGDLDVDVERSGAGGAQLAELGGRQVGRDVDRRRAELLERPGGGRVRAREQDGRLEHERLGQVAGCFRRPSSARTPTSATRNERMPKASPRDLGDAPLDACVAAGHSADCARRERLPAGVPGAARAEEERHLDPVLGAELGHLLELAVGEHHHARALGDAAHGHVAGICFLDHSTEGGRPLDRRDLDAVAEAVRESRFRGAPSSQASRSVLGAATVACNEACHRFRVDTCSRSSCRRRSCALV